MFCNADEGESSLADQPKAPKSSAKGSKMQLTEPEEWITDTSSSDDAAGSSDEQGDGKRKKGKGFSSKLDSNSFLIFRIQLVR